jgi:hypothetical protein
MKTVAKNFAYWRFDGMMGWSSDLKFWNRITARAVKHH